MFATAMLPSTYADFAALSPRQRGELLVEPDGRLRALLYAQQYTRPILDRLLALAERLRSAEPDGALRRAMRRALATRSAALYFTQPSTRTYTSFSLAAQACGMFIEEIRDSERASIVKGETQLDTLLTLAELADCVIMRHHDPQAMDRFAYEVLARGLPTRIVNGGSGSDQHPTQALLELYTLAARFELGRDDAPFTLGIVGDLKRARTARSLSYLLALYPQVRQVFIAPDDLQMGDDLCAYLDERGVVHDRTEDFDAAIPDLDAIYVMRMQDEYGETSDALRELYGNYRLTPARAEALRPDACILHPLPRRDELPIEIDHDPRAAYWEAVNRGRWVRSALLLWMFDAEGALN